MAYPHDQVFFVILLLEAVMGSFSSFSMIACLYTKGFQKKNMMTYSRILIPHNVSNICYTIVFSVNIAISFLKQELYNNVYVCYISTCAILYSITSSLWLTGVLCVFYFMKIIPSQPGLLTTLKSRMDVVIRWLIILAEVVSLGGSFLSTATSYSLSNQWNSSASVTKLMEETNAQSVRFVNIVLFLNSLPFLIIMLTTIGSAWFLKLYDSQIQKNLVTSGNSCVRSYRAAIKTMIGLLVLYSSILVSVIISCLNLAPYPSLRYWMCLMVFFSFPSVLSALLICGNPKLKEAFLHMFLCS
ncbi:hypothetical protein GDO81_025945 [Engystomops pustulosus]|uniref:Taste receptor type 2 n=1 Tax=Engystomops pustulosus TaxID=76066 RepID=A0AAV6ZGJ1_ENGPU|nr:hypothetical protein GDO81_025945 [Engystomops pustulosus]